MSTTTDAERLRSLYLSVTDGEPTVDRQQEAAATSNRELREDRAEGVVGPAEATASTTQSPHQIPSEATAVDAFQRC